MSHHVTVIGAWQITGRKPEWVLTPRMKQSIRLLYARGEHSQADLAGIYGVGRGAVLRVISGKF